MHRSNSQIVLGCVANDVMVPMASRPRSVQSAYEVCLCGLIVAAREDSAA